MKTRYQFCLGALLAMTTLTSCNDWLTEDTPGTNNRDEFFVNLDAAKEVVNAAYVPLQWEYSSNTTYYPEWFVGDVASDDALKGGQNITDMGAARDIENFKVTTNNDLLLGYYRAQWEGVGRANLAIDEIPKTMNIDESDEGVRDRLLGEAYYLRAYYYFRLVRMFGGQPLIDYVIDSSDKWAQTRATADETYAFIIRDLERADSLLPVRTNRLYGTEDLGRVTQGAADAMLMKANLYRGDFQRLNGDESGAKTSFAAAKNWGAKVINSGVYSLDPTYFTNFLLEGENDNESVFEIQYTDDPTSDYGSAYEGAGATRGTFTVILTRSRSGQICAGGGFNGWGFNRPTWNLYNEYEDGDVRRDATIMNPDESLMDNPSQEVYLGTPLLSTKYAMYNEGGSIFKLSHDTRGPINNKQIRYADVLLMYAEACAETGDNAAAKNALNQVRSRAGLAAFPYSAKIQGENTTFSDNASDLMKAIRHERRVELAMEGHRWFDLCRWGIAKETMDNYIKTESAEAQAEYGQFVKGVHELMPIPAKEIDLGATQNPGYGR